LTKAASEPPGERIMRAEGPCPFCSHIRTTSRGVGSQTGKFEILTVSDIAAILVNEDSESATQE
jgi:hypothetical protein